MFILSFVLDGTLSFRKVAVKRNLASFGVDMVWFGIMLTTLLPVSRAWTMDGVCEALSVSDIPRERLILILDAPGCRPWGLALTNLGFDVEVHMHDGGTPPTDRIARRISHNKMREFTVGLVPDGPLLCLDDDTIVPPDVYTRLSRAGEHASGVQISRWGSPRCGVYRGNTALSYQPGHGVESIDYCGHYCVLTTGEMYRKTTCHAADACYMQPIPGLVVDWGCVCGHLTKEGILWP
jgi:hypothetical protein